jgi:enamine deaminase RidA (YjgF/YER057c/UK114 family)
MKFSAIAFEPRAGDTLESQVSDCLEQLNEFVSGASLTLKNIISISFFLSAGSKEAYRDLTRRVGKCLSGQISDRIPVACLAQAPASGAFVSAEVFYIASMNDVAVVARKEEGNLFLVIRNRKGDKLVIANDSGKGNGNGTITENAEQAFGLMEKILRQEGLDFSNVFRQWNYIEDITAVEPGNRNSQHYQQFNNVRSKYYSGSDFVHGYPAATGIGIRAGGVILSFFAASEEGYHIRSIENPLQRSAYQYSGRVLAGDAGAGQPRKSTPKFARAKYIANNEFAQVFISGTASIRGEAVTAVNDVARQTEITLDNMQQLISRDSISAPGDNTRLDPQIEFIRVYIKYPEDYPAVKKICENRLPGVPGIYVVSDVCREDLLVEIEALASA